MTRETLEELKYPIGQFDCPEQITEEKIKEWIGILENFPKRLWILVSGLSDEQLDTAYRPDGWTIRQVVHHLSDSHHHSYIRFKWAMTEDNPLIKAYNEQDWSEQFDYKAPIGHSVMHLRAVHDKLVYYLKGLSAADLDRTFIHPESNETVTLKKNIGNYAWHSNHHYAHIENLILRMGW